MSNLRKVYSAHIPNVGPTAPPKQREAVVSLMRACINSSESICIRRSDGNTQAFADELLAAVERTCENDIAGIALTAACIAGMAAYLSTEQLIDAAMELLNGPDRFRAECYIMAVATVHSDAWYSRSAFVEAARREHRYVAGVFQQTAAQGVNHAA